jgi:P4 family phage/plasmid primase-like protien
MKRDVSSVTPEHLSARIQQARHPFSDLFQTPRGQNNLDGNQPVFADQPNLELRVAQESSNLEERYALELGEQIGQVRCLDSEWFVHDPATGIWRPQSRDLLRPRALSLIDGALRKERFANQIISHLESRSQVPREMLIGAARFVAPDEVELAVANGFLRLGPAGARLTSPNAEAGYTIGLPVSYKPNAACEEFLTVLEMLVPDPAERELLLDIWATALIPNCRYEIALVMIGPAGTGKSTIASPLFTIFGNALSHLSLADLCHPQGYKLPNLEHKLINIGTELNTLELEDTGLFKQLVSGERIVVRRIYGAPFEMRNCATLVFLANSFPRFRNGTDAEVRRIRFVRFECKPQNPNVRLKERLKAQREGLFIELVRRACELLAGRPLAEQGAWGRATGEQFWVGNDPVGSFVQTHCRLGCNLTVGQDQLFEAFCQFRDDHGIPDTLNKPWFARHLRELYPQITVHRPRRGAKQTRMLAGIDLADESAD